MSAFKFEPPVIAVKKAEAVRFALKNIEGVHTFTIQELNIDIPLQEGQATTSAVAVPSRDGEFRLVCRFHELSGMVGTLRVGEIAVVPSPVATATPTPPTPIVTVPRATATPTSIPPTPTMAAPSATRTPAPAVVTPVATATPTIAAPAPAATTVSPTPPPATRGSAPAVQELAEIENYAANRFYPDRFTVVQGIPVRLYVTRLHREHINSFSIEPFVRSTAFFPPGTIGVIEFTPDRTGEFVMLNEGHGYRAALSVASSIGEASARSTSTGVQEFALVHDFSGGRLAPQRLVVQRGVPVRIYNTGLGGEDKVSISPFYLPTAANVMQGRITTFEFTPTMAGEFPISYEKGKLSGTLVVEDKR